MSDTIHIHIERETPVRLITVEPTGGRGAQGIQGIAGPNSVTSATTSDGTAEISFSTVTTEILTVTEGLTINTGDYNFGTGSAQALKDALEIASADITDATSDGYANKEKLLKTDSDGALKVDTLVLGNRLSIDNKVATFRFTPMPYDDVLGINTEFLTHPPYASGYYALTDNVNGIPDKITNGTIAGTLTINSTSYTYGTGAAAAHRDALGVAGKQSKSTTSAVTSTSGVAADISDLTGFVLEANATYRLTLHSIITTSSGGSFEFFFIPSGTTYQGGIAQAGAGVQRSGGVIAGGYHYGTTSFSPLYATQNLTNGHAYGEYYFRTSGTAGTAKMQFSQRVSAVAGTTTLASGTTVILEKIS